jgi:type II secretory pathway pseudopilin PulG
MPIMAAMLLPALAKAKHKADHIRCMNNVKQLNLGLIMYATDNNERLPAGTNWCDALSPYVKNEKTYLCASGNRAKVPLRLQRQAGRTHEWTSRLQLNCADLRSRRRLECGRGEVVPGRPRR